MRYIFLLFWMVMFFSCRENFDLEKVENLNDNKISTIGHAGMGIASQFPINSFESFSNAIALGVDGIEIDVQMTKDSVLIAFHDKFFEEKTSLNGLVSELNWNEIEGGIYKDPLYVNYKIISLDQLLENLPDKENLQFFFDCKLYEKERDESHVKKYVNTLLKIIDKYDLSNNVFVEFQVTSYLTRLKEIRPEIKSFIYTSFEYGLEVAKNLNLYGLIVSNNGVSTEQILLAHEEGFRVALFGLLSTKKNIDAIKKNPDFLQTDRVKHLVNTLK